MKVRKILKKGRILMHFYYSKEFVSRAANSAGVGKFLDQGSSDIIIDENEDTSTKRPLGNNHLKLDLQCSVT